MAKRIDTKTYGRVVYVDPNNTHYKDPDNAIPHAYEDYSIFICLDVTKYDRTMPGRVVWSNEFKYSANFMPGTNGFLSTSFTDVSQLTPMNGNAECLGIKSIDITYNSWFYPQVTINFTDVRGASLMSAQDKGLYDTVESERLGGNSATAGYTELFGGSLFKALFTFPYPEFKLTVKGFYGQPVTLRLCVEKMNIKLDSSSGNFDVIVSFIGSMYGLYTDIPMQLLTIAPYVNPVDGQLYNTHWLNGTGNGGDYFFEGEGGSVQSPICTYPELKMKLETFMNQEPKLIQERGNDIAGYASAVNERNSLNELLGMNPLNEMEYIDTQKAYWTYSENWDEIISLIDRVKNFSNECEKKDIYVGINTEYSYILDNVKRIESTDYNHTITYEKRNIGSDFSLYGENTQETLIYVFKPEEKYVEGGEFDFTQLDTSETGDKFDALMGKICGSVSKNNIYHVLYIKITENPIQEINNRIGELTTQIEVENKKVNEVRGQELMRTLGFSPSIHNMFKMIFAHLDTFMSLFYDCLSDAENENKGGQRHITNVSGIRTDYGPKGVNEYDLPPFTMFYAPNSKGDSKAIDEFFPSLANLQTKGVNFSKPRKGELPEVELVRKFIRGAFANVNDQIEKRKAIEEMRVVTENLQNGERSNYEYTPSLPYDFMNNRLNSVQNPYVYLSNPKIPRNKIGEYAARIYAMRYEYAMLTGGFDEYGGHTSEDPSGMDEVTSAFRPNVYKKTGGVTNFATEEAYKAFSALVNVDSITLTSIENESKTDNKYNIYKDYDGKSWLPVGDINLQLLDTNFKIDKEKLSGNIICADKYSETKNNFEICGDYNFLNPGKIDNNSVTTVARRAIMNKFGKVASFTTESINQPRKIAFTKPEYYIGHSTDGRGIRECVMFLSLLQEGMVTDGELVPCSNGPEIDYNLLFEGAMYYLSWYEQTDDTTGAYYFPFDEKNFKVLDETSVKIPDYITDDRKKRCIEYFKNWYETSFRNSYRKYELSVDGKLWDGDIDGRTSLDINYEYQYVDSKNTVSKNGMKIFGEGGGINSLPLLPNMLYVVSASVKTGQYNIIEGISGQFQVNGEDDKVDYIRRVDTDLTKKVFFKTAYHTDMNKKILNTRLSRTTLFGRLEYHTDIDLLTKGKSTGWNSIKYQNINSVCSDFNIGNKIFVCDSTPLSYNSYEINKTGTPDQSVKSFLSALSKLVSEKAGGSEFDASGSTVTIGENGFEEDFELPLYNTFCNLYKKWLCGKSREIFTLKKGIHYSQFNNFEFIDSYYNKIGHELMLNATSIADSMASYIESDGSNNDGVREMLTKEYSIYQFMSLICQKNGLLFLALPCKFADSAKEIGGAFDTYPYSSVISIMKNSGILYSKDELKMDYTKVFDTTSYVCMYVSDPSENLSNASQYLGDGFDIAPGEDLGGTAAGANQQFIDNDLFAVSLGETYENAYRVPAFGVSYGKGNQSYFKNISLSMDNAQTTNYSIMAMLNIADKAASTPKSTVVFGQDLYRVYANYSYVCTVEMMGCMQIMPLMYFQLNNVPMWKGAYMVSKVSHKIGPGTMSTTFGGYRVSKYRIPLVKACPSYPINIDVSAISGGRSYYEGAITGPAYHIKSEPPIEGYPVVPGSNFYEKCDFLERECSLRGWSQEDALRAVDRVNSICPNKWHVFDKHMCTKYAYYMAYHMVTNNFTSNSCWGGGSGGIKSGLNDPRDLKDVNKFNACNFKRTLNYTPYKFGEGLSLEDMRKIIGAEYVDSKKYPGYFNGRKMYGAVAMFFNDNSDKTVKNGRHSTFFYGGGYTKLPEYVGDKSCWQSDYSMSSFPYSEKYGNSWTLFILLPPDINSRETQN